MTPWTSNSVRGDLFGNLKLWLIDNGVEWFYHGFFEPANDSPVKEMFPLVAFIPDDPPEDLEASGQFGFQETGKITLFLWLVGSDENRLKPARDKNGEPILDRGDLTMLDQWHQKLLAGPNPFARYFPSYTSAAGVTGGQVKWQELLLIDPPYVCAQIEIDYHTRVAPEVIPDPNS